MIDFKETKFIDRDKNCYLILQDGRHIGTATLDELMEIYKALELFLFQER